MTSRIIQCGSCSTQLKVPNTGGTIQCPSCQAKLKIPPAAGAAPAAAPQQPAPSQGSAVSVKCPGCTSKMRVPANAQGKTVRCPKCSATFKVPGGQAAPAPSPAPAASAPAAPAANPFDDFGGGGALPSQQPAANNPFASQGGDPFGGPAASAPTGGAGFGGGGFSAQAPNSFSAGPGYSAPAAGGNPYATSAPAPAVGSKKSGGLSGIAISLICFFAAFLLSAIPVIGFAIFILTLIVAGIASSVAGIMILVKAFEEDTTKGLLCLFLPFYFLVYMINSWERIRSPGLIYVGTTCAMIGSLMGFFLGVLLTALIFGPAQ